MRRQFQRLARWAARLAGFGASGRPSRGGSTGRFGFEGLERREVMSTTGTVTPFLEVPGQINVVGQTTQVEVPLSPTTVSAPSKSSSLLIGLLARPAPGSPVDPVVGRLTGPGGADKPPQPGSNGRPFIVRLNVPRTGTDTYTAEVGDVGGKTGTFVVDAFLPGDVNGDLRVDQADLNILESAYGSRIGQSRYNRAADINQDGVVGCRDRWYLRKNLGATASFVTNPPPVAAPTVAPAPAAPVVTPVQPTVTTVTSVATIVPVTRPVALTTVAPVATPVVTTPVAVASTPVAAQAANVVWIPVLASSVGATAAPGVAAGSMPVQAYAPTTQAPMVYYTVPAGSTTTATTTPVQAATTVPSGPLYYYSMPTTTTAGTMPLMQTIQPTYAVATTPR